MRRFLYLNNDSLYSYISQINNGLPISSTDYSAISEEKSKDINSDVTGEFNADLKILSKGFDAALKGNIGDSVKKSNTKEVSNSIEKKIFDEAFDKLEKHLNSNSLIKNKNLIIGDFLKIKDEMFIVDLDYYKNIFSTDTVLDFVKKSEIENRLNTQIAQIEVTGNGEKANYDKEKIRKEIKKQVDTEYIEIKKIIEAIINIIPYNKFGIMGECLIVLDDEYFRDKTGVVAYKYGGQMTMLGYLTNIVNSNITQTDEIIFRTFPSIINTFMLSFFNKTEIKIIHPVAIYY